MKHFHIIKQTTIDLDDTAGTIEDIDDESIDPDWVKTPLAKLRRKTTVRTILFAKMSFFRIDVQTVLLKILAIKFI